MKLLSKRWGLFVLCFFLCMGIFHEVRPVTVMAASKITVKFNANGGSVKTKTKKVIKKKKYGTMPNPTRSGYRFTGWYTKKSGGKKKTKSSKVTASKTHTLYAHWSANTYNIQFDGNESTGGSMKIMTVKYGKSVKLTKNKYKLSGCTFQGWSTVKNGKVKYKNGQAIKNLSKKHNETVVLYAVWKGNTSTKSRYDSQYKNYLASTGKWSQFENSVAILNQNKSTLIPGLSYTNLGNGTVCTTMVPQGTCILDKYLLVSAYDHSGVNHSVIYVIDQNTRKYLTTILLDFKSHVGSLTCDPSRQILYIADTDHKGIWCMPFQSVKKAVSSKKDTYAVHLNKKDSYFSVAVEPAFLTYYDGKLFTGNYDQKNANNSYTLAYDVQNSKHSKTAMKLMLPIKCQGFIFADYQDKTYMICSCSYGRRGISKLYVYEMQKTNDSQWIQYVTNDKNQPIVKEYTLPNMSEDVDISGSDDLYICFESGANPFKYINNKSTKQLKIGEEIFPIDRVLVSSLSKTIGATTLKASGSCGDQLSYAYYADGSLTITGEGDMYHYSKKAAPWQEVIDQITQVNIGAGVTSIGDGAFAGAENLKNVTVSDFGEDQTFVVGKNAFADCDALSEVSLPDQEITLKENALPFDHASLEISSDSQSVKEYCETYNLSLHEHQYQYVKTIEPNCGMYGYDIYRCECGKEEYRNQKDTVGTHEFIEIKDEYGNIAYQCKKCHAFDVDVE